MRTQKNMNYNSICLNVDHFQAVNRMVNNAHRPTYIRPLCNYVTLFLIFFYIRLKDNPIGLHNRHNILFIFMICQLFKNKCIAYHRPLQ